MKGLCVMNARPNAGEGCVWSSPKREEERPRSALETTAGEEYLKLAEIRWGSNKEVQLECHANL